MSLLQVFHSVATGSRRTRELLTPLGLLIFGLTVVAPCTSAGAGDRVIRHRENAESGLSVCS